MFSFSILIPLRDGSKGIINKNIIEICNKKLYEYTLDLAIKLNPKKIILTTDIPLLLEKNFIHPIYKIKRPKYLCKDDSNMDDVILHSIYEANMQGLVVLLQPTSPLRIEDDVLNCLSVYINNSFDVVMTVSEIDKEILKSGFILNDKFISISNPKYPFYNRQFLPNVYKPNGLVYIFDADWFKRNKGFQSKNIGTLITPIERSIDINNYDDLIKCEEYIRQR